MVYSKTYQEEVNGPLVASVRQRIRAVKEKLGYSWADMGGEFAFSNTFVLGIAREDDPMRIRSKHIERLIQNLGALEVKAGIAHVAAQSSGPALASVSTSVANLSLEELVHAISAKGFSVTITPNSKS